MHAKLLVLSALTTISLIAKDPVKLTQSFKEGDKTAYKMHITEILESADADVDCKYTETVKKADNGAELDISTTDFKITAGGMDIPAPGPEPRTIKVDKNGVLLGGLEEGSVTRLLPDLYAGFAFGNDLTPGQDVAIDYSDPTDSKAKTTGTVTLDSVKDGMAKIVEKLSVSFPGEQTPLKVDLTAYVDVATSKLDHMEGKLTNIPPKLAGRYMVQSAEFKIAKV